MRVFIIVISIVLTLIFLFFLITFLFYRFVFYSPRKGQISDQNLLTSKNYQRYEEKEQQLIANIMKVPFEDVYINSFDKLKLHARLFENKKSTKVAILIHGYRGTAYRDFCEGLTLMLELGYNVLLVDQRAHGLSEGHAITFGVNESKDLLMWLDYAKDRFVNASEIVLYGVSMGAFTVLNISNQIDKNIKLIADSPYSSPKEVLKAAIKSIHLPAFLIYPLLSVTAKMYAHVNLNKISAFDSVAQSDNKILIIHGDNDRVVPHKLSLALKERYPNKIRYELFIGAGHGVSYLWDTMRYQEIIREYLIS